MTSAAPQDMPVFHIDWGLQGILRLISSHRFDSVLDIGSGSGDHARLLRHLGKTVTTVDAHRDADVREDYLTAEIEGTFDVAWCSHVLEHQRNVNRFLRKVSTNLAEGGLLAISVPTHPPDRMVAGHVTHWTPALLCYNLILAGFDCREAAFTQTVDLSLIVAKRPALAGGIPVANASDADLYPGDDSDPFARLAPLFPFPVRQGGDAKFAECAWGGHDYRIPAGTAPFRLMSRFLPAEGLLIGD